MANVRVMCRPMKTAFPRAWTTLSANTLLSSTVLMGDWRIGGRPGVVGALAPSLPLLLDLWAGVAATGAWAQGTWTWHWISSAGASLRCTMTLIAGASAWSTPSLSTSRPANEVESAETSSLEAQCELKASFGVTSCVAAAVVMFSCVEVSDAVANLLETAGSLGRLSDKHAEQGKFIK